MPVTPAGQASSRWSLYVVINLSYLSGGLSCPSVFLRSLSLTGSYRVRMLSGQLIPAQKPTVGLLYITLVYSVSVRQAQIWGYRSIQTEILSHIFNFLCSKFFFFTLVNFVYFVSAIQSSPKAYIWSCLVYFVYNW